MLLFISVGELSFTIEIGQLIVKVGPKIFSIQQVVSSATEMVMCVFIVIFFRRLHAERTKNRKESEALTHDDELAEEEEEEEEANDEKKRRNSGNNSNGVNEISLDEIHPQDS